MDPTMNPTMSPTEAVGYSAEEALALSVVSTIASTISFACVIFIIICYFMFKDLRLISYSFVFYMSVATAVRQLAKMLGGHFQTGHFVCSLQAFLITYGGLSTFLWIQTIAVLMYTMIFHSRIWYKKPRRLKNCHKFALIYNFVAPFLFALLPVFTNSYAHVGGWCWIGATHDVDHVWRWVCYYGQLVFILLFCVFAYVRIWWFVRKHKDIEKLHRMYDRIRWYPVCLLLGYTESTFKRAYELSGQQLGYGWSMVQAITTGFFGLYLLIVYGRLGKLYRVFREEYPVLCVPFCDRFCGCCARTDLSVTARESETRTANLPYEKDSKLDENDTAKQPTSVQMSNGDNGDAMITERQQENGAPETPQTPNDDSDSDTEGVAM